MNKLELQDLIRNLQALIRCPSCGAHYKSDEIQFLGQVDIAWLLQLNCASCSLPVIATVMVSDAPRRRKVLSDLRIDEFERLPGDPVTADDILDIHEDLRALGDADLAEVFSVDKPEQIPYN